MGSLRPDAALGPRPLQAYSPETTPELLIRPLTYTAARDLLESPQSSAQEPHVRLLRARALLATQSYELARAELAPLVDELSTPLLKARAQIDLLHLCYYLGGRSVADELFERARTVASQRPLLLADLYLGLSLVATAENRMRRAVDALRFAEDALRAEIAGHERDLMSGRVQRQLVHVLAQMADYQAADRAAREAFIAAQRVDETWEVAWATYTLGFASWLRGQVSRAAQMFQEAEEKVASSKSPLWRWILFCLAHIRAEMGQHRVAQQLAAESAFDAPEEYAYLLLLSGDLAAARQVLTDARRPTPAEMPFRDAVKGILRLRERKTREAIGLLVKAEEQFRATHLLHYALGCSLHGAYAREQITRGAGRRPALHALRHLQEAGAAGFAWFDPVVADWLAEVAESTAALRPVAHALRARASVALVHAFEGETDRAARYRSLGLTWREIEIIQALELGHKRGRARVDRKTLAKQLHVSPNTLRVHLTHIRRKLGVRRRGDLVLLEPGENDVDE